MKSLFATVGFVSIACAQSTLHVGVGQPYPDMATAIAAAAPGDRLLVHAGSYAEFVLNKGLIIRAEPPSATVVVSPGPAGVIVELPPGQTAIVERLMLDSSLRVGQPLGFPGAGVLSLSDTTCSRGITVTDAHVVIRGCTVDGGAIGGGLVCGVTLAGAANFSALQSTIRGNNGWFGALPGVLATQQSQLHLAQCVVTGGYAASVHQVLGLDPGVRLTGSARGWFVDSTLQARQYPGLWSPIGIGLDNQSSNPAVIERTNTVSSQGTSPSIAGNVVNDLVLGVSTNTPLVRGGVFQLNFASRPGFPVVTHATFTLATPTTYPVIAQRDFGFVTNSLLLSVAAADAAGRATTPVAIPNLAAILDLPLWFAAWSGDSFPVQLSPTLGGLIR